ncbi:uncharacterized protein LOC135149533 [Daucus carota subsp. sativus]|uniref:uncharacterized protein LOC135149533 n=1 Tax=Daucus carota subsp. sativus TaxID=79200 RepID=UPI00308325C4
MTFWGCLDDLVRSITLDQFLFVGGDFNGHIGARADGYQGVHGGFGYGVRNDNGSTLLEFATAHDLVIVNSSFRKRDDNLITFRSGGHATQIDYLLIRMEACASQHRLLVMDLSLDGPPMEGLRVVTPRILWRNLHGSKVAEFKDMLEGFFRLEDDVDQMWIRMADLIRGVARRTLGVASGIAKEQRESWWWNDDVQAKVQFKNGCFLEFMSCPEGPDRHIKRELFKLAKRMAKQAVAEAKTKAYQDMYKRLGTKEGVNEIFKLAKARNKRSHDIGAVRYIKDEGDRVLLYDGDIIARWGRYFSELFNAARGREIVFEQENVNVSHNDVGMSQDITMAEVRVALGMMGKGKTIGLDEIPIEVWQCLGEQGVRWLTALLMSYFGHPGCRSYDETWERVIECRIRRIVTISVNQFGFMPGRSTIEAIYLIRCLMEKYRECRKDLHMVFIDLEKAYDSVPRVVLWRCLAARGVPEVYIRTIQDMYSAVGTCVRTPVGDTQYFPVEVGLHQGSVLSPLLFIIVLDVITRDIQAPVPWCMLFADDIVLIAESRSEVNVKLEQWRMSLEGYGLRLSRSKTEYLWANFSEEIHEADVAVCIVEARVPQTNTFKYLSSIIQSNGDISADVTHRISTGWLHWWAATGCCVIRMYL